MPHRRRIICSADDYDLLLTRQLGAVILQNFEEFRAEQQQGNHIGNHDKADCHIRSSALHALLSGFNLYQAPQSEYQENLDSQMANLLQNRITQLISENGVLPTRLSREEKIRIVHKLNEEGLLNVKGAVAEIAERLSVSVPTLYRYLNKGSADSADKA